jgi:hypothetical protein
MWLRWRRATRRLVREKHRRIIPPRDAAQASFVVMAERADLPQSRPTTNER